MLINTVILLLRDGLPIVFLLVFLLHTTPNKHWLMQALGLTSLIVALLLFTLDSLSQAFNGIGIELVTVISQISVYVLLLLHLYAVIFKPNLSYNNTSTDITWF